MWTLAEHYAAACGFPAELFVAIQVLETGWYTSELFIAANNPASVPYFLDAPFPMDKITNREGDFGSFQSYADGVHAQSLWYTIAARTIKPKKTYPDVVSYAQALCKETDGWRTQVTQLYLNFKKLRGKE
jgi:hypothetical protein